MRIFLKNEANEELLRIFNQWLITKLKQIPNRQQI